MEKIGNSLENKNLNVSLDKNGKKVVSLDNKKLVTT